MLNCFWYAASARPTWIKLELPNETYIDYVELDPKAYPNNDNNFFRVSANGVDVTPPDFEETIQEYYNNVTWSASQAENCAPKSQRYIRVPVNGWVSNVKIFELYTTSTNDALTLGFGVRNSTRVGLNAHTSPSFLP